MKTTGLQITFAETNPEYEAFVEKFKPKKTTDDCYTPPNVYEAVLSWVVKTYGVDRENVVRPFWPGGDYQREPYTAETVVVDNPPFSILSQIVEWYLAHEIRFFLFSPYLTNFGTGTKVCHIIAPVTVRYENGAEVDTAFLTNMDDRLVVGDIELFKAIEAANKENLAAVVKPQPKYQYPVYVLTAANVGYFVKHGIQYELERRDAMHIRKLDSQAEARKSIFGSGFLLSERAVAERAVAERAAAERAKATQWRLSDRELEWVRMLGGDR